MLSSLFLMLLNAVASLASFPSSSHRIPSVLFLLHTGDAIFLLLFCVWGLLVLSAAGGGMETAAAALLEAGVGRFSRAPAMAAALLAEMWAPLAVALAALATLPSLLRRLQVIVLRLRSCGKEVIQSHIGTYYSSCDEDGSDDGGDEDESSDDEASSSGDDDEAGEDLKRIGFYDGAADGGVFPWGGAVVRTWQGLPRRFPGCSSGLGGAGSSATGGALVPAAVRLWGASTASGEQWWADEGGCRRDGAAAEAQASADQVVVGWRREHASQRRRRAVPLAHTTGQ